MAKEKKISAKKIPGAEKDKSLDTFKNPRFRDKRGKLCTFDRVVANPMWNLDWFTESN